jgi:hypothetical protein
MVADMVPPVEPTTSSARSARAGLSFVGPATLARAHKPRTCSPSPPSCHLRVVVASILRVDVIKPYVACGSGSAIPRAVMEGRSSVMEGDRQDGEPSIISRA